MAKAAKANDNKADLEEDPLAAFGLTLTDVKRPAAARTPGDPVETAKKNVTLGLNAQLARVEAEQADQDVKGFKIDGKAVRAWYWRENGRYNVEMKYGPVSVMGKGKGFPAGTTLEDVAATLRKIQQAVNAGALDAMFEQAYQQVAANSAKAREARGQQPQAKASQAA